ncbi:glutamine-dependent NAD(+) synthetase [Xylographa carneopallida]|nr:glutamine-dependent NAD(+) synthetase [Xylographa carneopallida]
MGHLTTLATCNLNQWALDFDGNQERIIESIRQAKAAGASLRVGPELEITGYGLLDHFLEGDTFLHSWESLVEIIIHKECQDILLDMIIVYNKEILLIRPKLSLANDGNYREMRYFTPWKAVKLVEEYYLPRIITKVTGQNKVPIGDAVITPMSPHMPMSLDGVEIFTNSSGSHHELRKLNTRIDLIKEATLKAGGIYLYANQQGCDGDRLYYDGSCMIVINGRIVAQGSQFSLHDVEVVTATVDLEDVRSYRNSRSRAMQAKDSTPYRRIEVGISLSSNFEDVDPMICPSKEIVFRYHVPEEEIALGPACFLWDYLRRSRQAGYFLPLSGGIDSCATAVIIHSMCRLVDRAIKEGDNPQVLADLLRIAGEDEDSDWRPKDPQDIASRIFHTAYMGMRVNSSTDTRARAKDLGKAIGSYHLNFDIDTVVSAVIALCTAVTAFTPKYKMYGGTSVSNLALQNIQARLRMVLSYMFAQLLPTVRGRTKPGSLLVLGSANVDESLRGYLTKYDCSSADINPIGAISKTDLKRFILWAGKGFDMPLLQSFIDAPPTAELEPITDDYTQSDEVVSAKTLSTLYKSPFRSLVWACLTKFKDMGMSYNELSMYGRLRKVDKLGPYGMWRKLLHEWGNMLSPQEIYEKTRSFFWYYSINRHKMTTVTPAYHAEQYSPDDNRFDLRPFLYPSFDFAYRKIEKAIKAMGTAGTKRPEAVEKNE